MSTANISNSFPVDLNSKGTACVGTSGPSSWFGTYDQSGNVEEYVEKGVLFATTEDYIPPDYVVGVGFQSAKYTNKYLDEKRAERRKNNQDLYIETQILNFYAWFDSVAPQYARHIPQDQRNAGSNLIFINDEHTPYLQIGMYVSGPGVSNNTKVEQIETMTYDYGGIQWRMVRLDKNLDWDTYDFNDGIAGRVAGIEERIYFGFRYLAENENIYQQISTVLVADYIPEGYGNEYPEPLNTLFVPVSSLGAIRTGWAVYGDNVPDNTYVRYVSVNGVNFPEINNIEYAEVVLNNPYIAPSSMTTNSNGSYGFVSLGFLSGFYGETALPPPLPTTPTPEPIQIRASFGYGKALKGGSFLSSEAASGKNAPLSYLPINDFSESVGFRIASIAEERDVDARFYDPNSTYGFGLRTIFIEISTIASTYEEAATLIRAGMKISGNGIDFDTYVISVAKRNDTWMRVTISRDMMIDELSPHGLFGTTVCTWPNDPVEPWDPNSGTPPPPPAAPSPFVRCALSTLNFSMSNPAHMKNMVLVGDEGNAPDGFTPGYGRVNYKYWIGKYTVTNSEYVAFLNNVANTIEGQENLNALYNPASSENNLNMSVGIDRDIWLHLPAGLLGNNPDIYFIEYASVDGMSDHPVVGISWTQAAQYCNWLHNNSNGNWGSTQVNTGAYNFVNETIQNMRRASHARYFIPNENEWYKAAYGGKRYDGYYSVQATRQNSVTPVAYQDSSEINIANTPDAWNNGLPMIEVEDFTRRGVFDSTVGTSLFNRFVFDEYISRIRTGNCLRWISIFNRAADILDSYISHARWSFGNTWNANTRTTEIARIFPIDTSLYDNMRRNCESLELAVGPGDNWFRGCRYSGMVLAFLTFYHDPTSSTIASCGTVTYRDNTGTRVNLATTMPHHNQDGADNRTIPLAFATRINLAQDANLTDEEWVKVLTHEMCHAMGFGTVTTALLPLGSVVGDGINNTYISNEAFPNMRDTVRTYNDIAYGANSRVAVPLEGGGGAGTAGGHWENDAIANGYCPLDTNCPDPVTYAGITNELMTGFYNPLAKLSRLTLNFFKDLGYHLATQDDIGEGDFDAVYPEMQVQQLSSTNKSSKKTKNRIIGKCSKNKK